MLLSRRLFSVIAIGAVIVLSFVAVKKNDAEPFHSKLEMSYFDEEGVRSPIDSGQYFLGSIRCKGCHGYDTLQVANVDSNGVDINLYDDWQTTMMANSAKDPLWRAKVSHEILVNPGHAGELQTKCTACHAPLGHFTAIFHGASTYTINDLINDTLGLDGVSCGGCHEIGTENLGTAFSGAIPYDTTKKEFGPFQNPLAGPMQLYEGFTPTFSTHMSKSQVCSSCHTLITHTADLEGNYTGNTFIEQATYHEWLNSAFSQDNITCQSCHMPQLKDSIIIANNILALGPRSPFNQHQFAGGNVFMTNLIKQNKQALDITSPDKNFDSTLAATYRLLQQKTIGIFMSLDSIASDTLYIKVRLTNKAGHKFPSGYPSRRAVLQLVVTDQNLDTVFQSGTFDSNFEVYNIDPSYEPHYDVIKESSQVQLYEMVMGDVNNDVTTVLERADHMIKDNRLPPEGFISTHPDYDTVQIVGDALNDPDFNKTNAVEGSGMDFIHYHIPVNGVNGILNVYAGMYFQSVPPRYLEEMFSYSSAAIDTFKNMYFSADRTPVLLSSTQLQTPFILADANLSGSAIISLRNTLSESGVVQVINNQQLIIDAVNIFDVDGAL
ncbi:MAG: hypothetical protein ABI729_10570, partial [Chitinophagales bacterium]